MGRLCARGIGDGGRTEELAARAAGREQPSSKGRGLGAALLSLLLWSAGPLVGTGPRPPAGRRHGCGKGEAVVPVTRKRTAPAAGPFRPGSQGRRLTGSASGKMTAVLGGNASSPGPNCSGRRWATGTGRQPLAGWDSAASNPVTSARAFCSPGPDRQDGPFLRVAANLPYNFPASTSPLTTPSFGPPIFSFFFNQKERRETCRDPRIPRHLLGRQGFTNSATPAATPPRPCRDPQWRTATRPDPGRARLICARKGRCRLAASPGSRKVAVGRGRVAAASRQRQPGRLSCPPAPLAGWSASPMSHARSAGRRSRRQLAGRGDRQAVRAAA
jgi:hypothetical protein